MQWVQGKVGAAATTGALRLRHVGTGVYLCAPSAAERAARDAAAAAAVAAAATSDSADRRASVAVSVVRDPQLDDGAPDIGVAAAEVAHSVGGAATVFCFGATHDDAALGGAVARNSTVRLLCGCGGGESVATTANFADAMATAALSGVEKLFRVPVGVRVAGGHDSDAFVVRPVPAAEVVDVVSALSARPPLRAIAAELASGRAPSARAMAASVGVLAGVIAFVLDAPTGISALSVDGSPRPHRQRILREQGLLDACADILRTLFDGVFDLGTLRDRSPAMVLAQHCYRCLMFSFKGHARNAMYCAQWLPMIMTQSVQTAAADDLFAEEALGAMFDANRRILDDAISPAIVEVRLGSVWFGCFIADARCAAARRVLCHSCVRLATRAT